MIIAAAGLLLALAEADELAEAMGAGDLCQRDTRDEARAALGSWPRRGRDSRCRASRLTALARIESPKKLEPFVVGDGAMFVRDDLWVSASSEKCGVDGNPEAAAARRDRPER